MHIAYLIYNTVHYILTINLYFSYIVPNSWLIISIYDRRSSYNSVHSFIVMHLFLYMIVSGITVKCGVF